MFLKFLSIGRKLGLAFSLLVAISTTISYVTYSGLLTIEDQDKWTEHTHQVLARANELLNSLVDQQGSVRGYLYFANEKLLKQIDVKRKVFDKNLSELLELTSDNPAQQERLGTIKANEALWQVVVNDIFMSSEKQDKNLTLRTAANGIPYMDKIRSTVKDFVDAEEALLSV
ncbi:CHASE3 domain-containing protein [Paracoccus onubensis]|uniref:CHASE3 domain-containing protein n=1 Tax=Paracoccus onubensis TaxID=1675788 RepID=UPI0027304F49|nr:CHASE3 domain-containing protein [Paracoccus onubensis]MDP0927038.1 CHASE3 domain-containing protein [Paracoccus onubensis]